MNTIQNMYLSREITLGYIFNKNYFFAEKNFIPQLLEEIA